MSRGSNGYWLARRQQREAEEFAITLRPTIFGLFARGVRGATATADALNRRGYLTREGKLWHPMSALRVLRLLGLPTKASGPEPSSGIDQRALYEEIRRRVDAGEFDRIAVIT